MTTTTRRMTVGQALVEFLANQWTVDGDVRERTIPGIFGIFGHGNVAGVGQAIKQLHVEQPGLLPYHQARNEQAMVHEAVGFARMHRRRATFASTASVGPGAANMLTAAALATTNRLPALLLPSDTFATRTTDPVLQQIELPHDTSLQVTDAFRPLSRYFDRVERPEQLFSIALAAMRVLTDPAETGAVTIALPEDVQAEEFDVPVAFLQPREWHIRRPLPEHGPLARAVEAIRAAKRPVIVAGGGVLYSGAEDELRAFVEATGIPVGTSQAGGGSVEESRSIMPKELMGGRKLETTLTVEFGSREIGSQRNQGSIVMIMTGNISDCVSLSSLTAAPIARKNEPIVKKAMKKNRNM